MATSTIKLYSLSLNNAKTYIFATLFVIGNIIFPQLAHLVPQGGFIFLPIYFFTLIGAYKYGIHVGLLTAIFSPIINNLLFGMPPLTVLPAIIVKSIILAVVAAFMAKRFNKISIVAITLSVIAYQVVGTAIEWGITKDFFVALQDFIVGIPGILLQIVGGYFVLKAFAKI